MGKAVSVILATDGSPAALAAARWLNRFAAPDWTHITLLTVITINSADAVEDALDEARRRAERALERTEQVITCCPPINTVSVIGTPARAIVDYAVHHQADLIVLGRRGHSPLGNLLGSVSFAVIQHSPIPVTVVGCHDK